MAILKVKEARKLGDKEMEKRLAELRLELTKEKAGIAIGASATSPGRIREIRKAIARILTVKGEKKAVKASVEKGEKGKSK